MTEFSWGMAFGLAIAALYKRLRPEKRTRELDRQLAEMEREKGCRRGAGEQGLMREVL